VRRVSHSAQGGVNRGVLYSRGPGRNIERIHQHVDVAEAFEADAFQDRP